MIKKALDAGVKDNIIPSTARAILNCRVLPGETIKSTEDYIRATIGDSRVVIRPLGRFSSESSSITGTGSPAFQRLTDAVSRTVTAVLPAPYLNTGTTDSRWYRQISDGVVNFFPITDAKGAHGTDERLPIADLQRGIHMMRILITESDREFGQRQDH